MEEHSCLSILSCSYMLTLTTTISFHWINALTTLLSHRNHSQIWRSMTKPLVWDGIITFHQTLSPINSWITSWLPSLFSIKRKMMVPKLTASTKRKLSTTFLIGNRSIMQHLTKLKSLLATLPPILTFNHKVLSVARGKAFVKSAIVPILFNPLLECWIRRSSLISLDTFIQSSTRITMRLKSSTASI